SGCPITGAEVQASCVVKAIQQVRQPEGSARHGYAARNVPLSPPTLIGGCRWHPCLACSRISRPTFGITKKSCVYSSMKPDGETS
ncbi:hypothetical protein M405DRAFT_808949, partial [Rhizopogon salebrosus TDB-379]